ncbi:uncharacterized protein LOC125042986 isoform X2 [Penaeus chinensis]|nr:uncharacterized protein LOC125042986 isoform X2 [Penaeus chinensis]XP_047494820.1 uncharacterized protein LOC125042986 isoform X2 [Penaeus chinensis]XP_047494821.1 uncharacterized protein LOC125042986 isoform X2 [Penaeus chinensis]XP_047494822.1 uncharacterized protein LOC125042986 isoform X2 [Penaeus chinensis]XP_047494823.1 uncharacterized protein LOC125042986 isoform X2 [Penaeus chinensis]XP_047494824.1 uncharacterized protein LOC125042986 isoform X2 [Penaeus chinensis]XP_047494825.1 un
MLWEPSGCCCCSLRTGSLVLATIVIVTGTLGMINEIGALIVGDIPDTLREVCEKEENDNMDVDECYNFSLPIVYGVLITKLVLDIIQVTISILLVHGILKNKTRFMIPYMIMVLVGIIIMGLVALLAIGAMAYSGLWLGVFIFALMFGLIIFLETYCLLVVRALYLQLKRQKGQRHMILTEQGYSRAKTEEFGEYQ